MSPRGAVPAFHNEDGHPSIKVAAREFLCIGALPPDDHPHVYLDMGDADTIVCPYCATVFAFAVELKGTETDPPGCAFVETDRQSNS
jgi:uncharacterized Zn-finger protein